MYLSDKLLETSLEVRTSGHMNDCDTLGKHQHSFCEKKACFMNSLGFFEGFAEDFYKGNLVDLEKVL